MAWSDRADINIELLQGRLKYLKGVRLYLTKAKNSRITTIQEALKDIATQTVNTIEEIQRFKGLKAKKNEGL